MSGMDRQEGMQHISGIRQNNGKQRGRNSCTQSETRDKEQPQPKDAIRQKHIHLNWSFLKPEFSGKPEEILPHTVGGSKTMVSFSRAFRRNYMGTITKVIKTKILEARQYSQTAISCMAIIYI